MKAAVLSYPTSNNLGDPIQSIAAEQLLAEKPTSLDRDALDSYVGAPVRLIMNGWFMEAPNRWPPAKNIQPVFISFHLNPIAAAAVLSPQGIAYFKKHQPIGCRDFYTQRILEEKGIKTMFTGCLTLSLKREQLVPPDTARSGILVLSVHERMLPDLNPFIHKRLTNYIIEIAKYPVKQLKYQRAKKQLDHFLKKQALPVEFASQLVETQHHTPEERFLLARKQLEKIAKASYVITSRIHTALPAVAMGTPVLFLSDGLDHINQHSRLKGLDTFFPILKTAKLKGVKLSNLKPTSAHLPYVKAMKMTLATFFKLQENKEID